MWSRCQTIALLAFTIQLAKASKDFIPADGIPATSDLVKLRGFGAIDHYVTTNDGYILNLVEILNPTIPNVYSESKDVILFAPGISNSANFFIVNSVGATPKNYAHLDAGSMSDDDMMKLFANDSTANSLPFLASNFGHRIFLLNRRGTSGSEGHIDPDKQPFYSHSMDKVVTKQVVGEGPERQGPTEHRQRRQVGNAIVNFFESLFNSDNKNSKHIPNPRYWNFSLDEQMQYDIPAVIDYILDQTKKEKVAIVGHSTGSALTLMALSVYPDFLTDKISKAILLGPALYPTSARDILASIAARIPLTKYVGPVVPKSLLIRALDFIENVCSNIITRPTICIPFLDTWLGSGGSQLDLSLKYFRIATDLDGSYSFGSLVQAATKGKMHRFDHSDPQRNLIAYGQTSPPVYDVSRIKLKTISLWSGVTDGLVPYRTAVEIGNDMSVPVEQVYLNESGLLFNHISYSIHKNVSRLFVIPALKKIEL